MWDQWWFLELQTLLFLIRLQNVIIYIITSLAEDEDEQDDEEAEPLVVADTSRVEEIPPKEPIFGAMPLKSALKKRPAASASPSGTPMMTPLAPRQDHHHTSFKSVFISFCIKRSSLQTISRWSF